MQIQFKNTMKRQLIIFCLLACTATAFSDMLLTAPISMMPQPMPVAMPQIEPQPEPLPMPRLESTSNQVAQPEAAPKPQPIAESKPVAKPEPKAEPKPAPKPEPKSEPKVEKKAEPKPEPKVEPKPEPKPEPKQEPVKEEPKPEPKVEPEPLPVAETKPVDEPKKEIVFVVDRNFVEFTEDGGEARVAVTSDEKWNVSETPSWVTAQQKGNTLVVRAARNDRFSDREGDVVITNEHDVELRVVVAQEKNHDYLKLSAELINDVEGSGGLYTFTVNSNKEWQVNNTPKWCITEIKGDKLEVWLDENVGDATRDTQVEVFMSHLPDAKQVIKIHQEPYNHFITIKPNILTSSGKASLARVNVRTDQPTFKVEGLPSWCSVKEQDAQSFVLSIADNTGGDARKAECRVIIEGGNGQTLVIQQEERLNYVTVTPKIIRASARGGVITVRVASSSPWRVVNLPEWCEVTAQTEDSFKLSIGQNATGAPRSFTFSVSASGMRETVEIRQE